MTLICGTYMTLSLTSFLFGIGVVNDRLGYQNLTYFYERYVEEARKAFFLSSLVTGNISSNGTNVTYNVLTNNNTVEDITLVDQIATGFFIACTYFRSQIEFYFDAMLLMVCLTLWAPVQA